MRFHIITIFPDIFDSYLNESIIGRAIKNKYVSFKFYNPRDYVKDKNKTGYKPVDDKPYGGGPGMVMRAEPILSAVAKALADKKAKKGKVLVINFIPTAEKFTTTLAKNISKKYTDVILICGRYEGIDARIDKILKTKKISIGDYVITGGELPAMILIDCISRQIKGVLGKYESLEEERVSTSEVYTRPEILKYKGKNYKVPKVLLSGNHKLIEDWKKKK
ncbi:MAG: tRNA (guanosine(37)-N1)-methyltransferase TrmD [Candidatus Paceibacterota bacterium]|jgi:tRNA (guanine37-N1)-methyltransferase